MNNHLSIEGKLPEGYVILCSGRGGEYSFLVRNLGLSVECPHCGATAHSTELAMHYYLSKPSQLLQHAAGPVALRRASGRHDPTVVA